MNAGLHSCGEMRTAGFLTFINTAPGSGQYLAATLIEPE